MRFLTRQYKAYQNIRFLSLIENHYKKKALIDHEETKDEVEITHADI